MRGPGHEGALRRIRASRLAPDDRGGDSGRCRAGHARPDGEPCRGAVGRTGHRSGGRRACVVAGEEQHRCQTWSARAVVGLPEVPIAISRVSYEHDLEDAPALGSVPTAPVDGTGVLSSGFVRPVEGPISSRYGPRFHPILQVWKLHTGTDIGAACGTAVKAVKDGVVSFAGAAGGDGNRVVVDHGDGLASTYNHLNSYAAAVGVPVRQGQIIGYVGTTGLSTGCHLHFEVMVNGVIVDSGPYLDLAPAPPVTIPASVAATTAVSAAVTRPARRGTGAGHPRAAAAPPTSRPPTTTPRPSHTPPTPSTPPTSSTVTSGSGTPSTTATAPSSTAPKPANPTGTTANTTTTAPAPSASAPGTSTGAASPTASTPARTAGHVDRASHRRFDGKLSPLRVWPIHGFVVDVRIVQASCGSVAARLAPDRTFVRAAAGRLTASSHRMSILTSGPCARGSGGS